MLPPAGGFGLRTTLAARVLDEEATTHDAEGTRYCVSATSNVRWGGDEEEVKG